MTVAAQSIAVVRSSPVLPNDGIVDGFARVAVPHHCGFALIGDANGGHVGHAESRFLHGLMCRLHLGP